MASSTSFFTDGLNDTLEKYPKITPSFKDRIFYPIYGVTLSYLGILTMVKLSQMAFFFLQTNLYVPFIAAFATTSFLTVGITLGKHLTLAGLKTINFGVRLMTQYSIDEICPSQIKNMEMLDNY